MKKNTQKAFTGIGAIILIIFIGAYIASTRQRSITPDIVHQNVPYDVQVFADTFSPMVGQQNTIRFSVKLDGKPIDLAAKKIYPHASVVSENLGDVWFYHLDELTSPSTGVYEFTHQFTQAADYTLWIEMNNNTTVDHHGSKSDYIGKLTMHVQDAALQPSPVPEKLRVLAKSFVDDGAYTLEALPYSLTAGKSGTFAIVAKKDGKAVPILPHFDHFYILTSPSENLYTLEHPQMNEQGETNAVVGPVTFAKPGRYALWIRLFPDDGSGKVTDVAEGTLILEVK